MVRSLQNILSGIVGDHNYLVTSFGKCEIGVALSLPEHVAQMPFSTFILSNAGEYDLIGPGNHFRLSVYDPPSGTDIGNVVVASGEANKTVINVKADYSPDATSNPFKLAGHSTIAALRIAVQEDLDSVVFATPFGRTEDSDSILDEHISVEAMLRGIVAYLKQNMYTPHPHRILIRVTNRVTLQAADQIIERIIKEPLPKHIPPYSCLIQKPLVASQSDSNPAYSRFSATDLKKPATGFVRLISNALLDHALCMVPDFIRKVDKECPPPYLFSRVQNAMLQGDSKLFGYCLIGQVSLTINDKQSGMRYVSGEIGLSDIPQSEAENPDVLADTIIRPLSALLTANLFRRANGSSIVPDEIHRQIESGLGAVEPERLTADELRRLLAFDILHECAEIFYQTLPRKFQQRWNEIYPLGVDKPGDFIHYRNLLRLYTDWSAGPESRPEFYGIETFADKLALFWIKDVPQAFYSMGCMLTREERQLFDEVMKFAQVRREHFGSAFVID